MNIYIFIIIAILFEYLLSILINIEFKNLSNNLPEEFSDLFDNKKYLKSQRYTKETSNFLYLPQHFLQYLFW